VGTEALDEVVGSLKVQLAPKTNFWSNAAGALNVAKTVLDMLKPTPKTTVLEIGCGIGVIGLMMASVSTDYRVIYVRYVTKVLLNEQYNVTSRVMCIHKYATLSELAEQLMYCYCIVTEMSRSDRG